MAYAQFSTTIEQPFSLSAHRIDANAVAVAFYSVQILHPNGEVRLFFSESGFMEFQRILLANMQPILTQEKVGDAP